VTGEQDCAYLLRNNYEYTKNLATLAIGAGVRFVYASSAATYGDGSNGMSDGETCLDALRPLNAYAYSKHLFDLFAARNGMPVYGMKYFNVFGPNEYHKGEMRSVVIKAYESVLQTGKMQIFRSKNQHYADGCQMRDFLYIKDAIDMTIFLADVDPRMNCEFTYGVYNCGSGQAHTWIDLVTSVFHALGTPVSIEYVDMPEELDEKYQYFTRGDIGKLRSIGYDGRLHTLDESVHDYVNNYLVPGHKRLQDVKNNFAGH
jgi:ADP-L-glycero-D-manno-heptose 6-epimerase